MKNVLHVFHIVVAERLVRKGQVTFRKFKVNVSLHHPVPRVRSDPRIIEVHGLTDKVHQEFLEMYFENERKGGGMIDSVKIEGDYASITFADENGILYVHLEFECRLNCIFVID